MDNIISEMIIYFQNDVKRINHALKVYGYAKAIIGKEIVSEQDKIVIEVSAILHDIGIQAAEKKYNSSAGKYQEIEGPPIAKGILADAQYDKLIVDRVCFLIGNHHSYGKINGIDFQILVESDFLVNIDEDQLDLKSIKSIKEKYFNTTTGKRILEILYGV